MRLEETRGRRGQEKETDVDRSLRIKTKERKKVASKAKCHAHLCGCRCLCVAAKCLNTFGRNPSARRVCECVCPTWRKNERSGNGKQLPVSAMDVLWLVGRGCVSARAQAVKGRSESGRIGPVGPFGFFPLTKKIPPRSGSVSEICPSTDRVVREDGTGRGWGKKDGILFCVPLMVVLCLFRLLRLGTKNLKVTQMRRRVQL